MVAWKVATDSLAVQSNRCRRHLAVQSTCSICGTEEVKMRMFPSFDQLYKSPELRYRLSSAWKFQGEEIFFNSGPD